MEGIITSQFGQVGKSNPLLKYCRFLGSGASKTANVLLFNDSGVVVANRTLTIGTTEKRADDNSNLFGINFDASWVGMVVISCDSTIYELASDGNGAVAVTSVLGRTVTTGFYCGIVPQEYIDAFLAAGDGGAPATAANQLNGFAQTVTPLTGTATYIQGDLMGNVATLTFPTINFSTGRPIRLDSLTISDKSHQGIPMTVHFFTSIPNGAGATYTDGSPITYGTGDIAKYIGSVQIAVGNWVASTGAGTAQMSVASLSDIGLILNLAGTSLFALIQTDGAGPYTLTAGDLTLTIGGTKL